MHHFPFRSCILSLTFERGTERRLKTWMQRMETQTKTSRSIKRPKLSLSTSAECVLVTEGRGYAGMGANEYARQYVFSEQNRSLHKPTIPRDYWMMYRGPDLLAVVWFGSSPPPHPLPLQQPASCLSLSVVLCFACRAYCRERVGEEPNHTTKPGPLIKYSLSHPIKLEVRRRLVLQSSSIHCACMILCIYQGQTES